MCQLRWKSSFTVRYFRNICELHIKMYATALPTSSPLKFPQKLWKIANECQTDAICWSADGKSILVRYSLFRKEFMSSQSDFFKTDNIASFVRQLNLYGFRKVTTHKQTYKSHSDVHEFSNKFFQRRRPDLLERIARKSVLLKDKNELVTITNKFTVRNIIFMVLC